MRTIFICLDRAFGETSDERITNLVALILVAVMPTLFALASMGVAA